MARTRFFESLRTLIFASKCWLGRGECDVLLSFRSPHAMNLPACPPPRFYRAKPPVVVSLNGQTETRRRMVRVSWTLLRSTSREILRLGLMMTYDVTAVSRSNWMT